jgi:hypothetical protein
MRTNHQVPLPIANLRHQLQYNRTANYGLQIDYSLVHVLPIETTQRTAI